MGGIAHRDDDGGFSQGYHGSLNHSKDPSRA
jgi:hypothetical protein